MTFKTVGPSESDAEMGIIIPGLDTPMWNVDMDHWLRFDVDPPPARYDNGKQKLKRLQPRVVRMRWWKNPLVFFNPNYKCAASTPIISGEIDNGV